MDILSEQKNDGVNFALIEISGSFYVVELDRGRHQVKSAIPDDCPDSGGQWFADFTEKGVKYVAKGRTRRAALYGFNKLTEDARP